MLGFTRTSSREIIDMKHITVISALVLVQLLTMPATAQQRSLDLEISKVFEEIDKRSRDYEGVAKQMLERLQKLEAQIAEEEARCRRIVKDIPAVQRENKKHECHARQTEQLARWRNTASTLYDRAAIVIAENTKAIYELYQRIRGSRAAANAAEQLHAKIQGNIAAGKAMRHAAQDLIKLSQEAPELAGHLKSLNSIMLALDRSITLDKTHVEIQRQNQLGTTKDFHLAAIETSLDKLLDMYNNLAVERAALAELREELKLAVYSGTLRAAVRTSEKAIPSISTSPRPKHTMVPGLMQISKRVWKLNQELLQSQPQGMDKDTAPITVQNFDNF